MRNWKLYAVLAVLGLALFLDYPTFNKLFIQDDASQKQQVSLRLKKIQDSLDGLKGLNLFLAQPESNRIRVIGEEDVAFSIDHPVISKILENHFKYEQTENGNFLVKADKEDIIIQRYAEKLNDLSENLRKIKEVKLNDSGTAIIFEMNENRRIAETTEPIRTFLDDDFDWFYDQASNSYLSSPLKSPYEINLGLDLQGGIYLDVGVETQKVIEQVLNDLSLQIEDVLIELDIYYDRLEVEHENNALRIYLESEDEEFDLEQDRFQQYTGNYDVTREGDSILITIPQSELDLIEENSVKQAIQTLRNRIDELGVREPSIQRKGENSIIIRLPGETDPIRAKELLTKTASLEFRLVREDVSPSDPGDGVVMTEEVLDPESKEVISSNSYVLEPTVAMRGDVISDARLSFSQIGASQVQITFNSAGEDIFGELTRNNVGKRLAIILDGKVQSAPVIESAILNGQAVINGRFTPAEATDLAIVLRSGKLPAPLVINEERTIGASLGEDSISDSLKSFIIGFAILVALIVIYYRIPGIFSVLALGVNILLMLAFLAYFGATLTLPGIAGIILTIGMAIDANVLIYERIKEELAGRNTLSKSIKLGFDRAFITIFDANFTTFIAGVVLLQFGTGSIKGFAVTLTIGILTSMFSAVFFTRYIFEVFYLGRKSVPKISF